jgi:hypothetical protein
MSGENIVKECGMKKMIDKDELVRLQIDEYNSEWIAFCKSCWNEENN